MGLRGAAAAALLTAASTAWATPVFYDEGVQGDLSALNQVILSLGAGVNTIQGVTGFGTLQQEAANNFVGDRDPFVLRVPAGLQVERATLTMWPIVGTVSGSSWLVVKDWDFGHPVADLGQSFNTYTQSWDLDLGPGDYLFHHGNLGGSFDSTWSFRWDIEAIQVTAVPEPETLSLLFACLAILPLLSGRRTRMLQALRR